MARPKPDTDAIRTKLLQTTEALLIQHGPEKVTVTDVATRCGMSQSNAYRFFPTKAALMAGVADRWFAEFEEALMKIAAGKGAADKRLRTFLLTQLKMKRARFDADPVLFSAYLQLATNNMPAVWEHVNRMSALLLSIVFDWLSEKGLDTNQAKIARDIIEDATLLFRDPNIIARRRSECTDRRANLVIDSILGGLRENLNGEKP